MKKIYRVIDKEINGYAKGAEEVATKLYDFVDTVLKMKEVAEYIDLDKVHQLFREAFNHYFAFEEILRTYIEYRSACSDFIEDWLEYDPSICEVLEVDDDYECDYLEFEDVDSANIGIWDYLYDEMDYTETDCEGIYLRYSDIKKLLIETFPGEEWCVD